MRTFHAVMMCCGMLACNPRVGCRTRRLLYTQLRLANRINAATVLYDHRIPRPSSDAHALHATARLPGLCAGSQSIQVLQSTERPRAHLQAELRKPHHLHRMPWKFQGPDLSAAKCCGPFGRIAWVRRRHFRCACIVRTKRKHRLV
jgi:hypothetical protein